MSFIDQRLPMQVELGAVRRERESIDIVRTDGNYEVRNARHSQAMFEYEISFPPGEFDASVSAEVKDLFRASRGGLHYFRFRDWDTENNTLTAELIGTGDGSTTTFQITKTTTVGGVTAVRKITRPVSAAQVYLNGVLQSSGYSVSYSTGIVTFTSAPTLGQTVAVSCTYDIPVRFDLTYEATAMTGWLEHIETLNLVEVRE